MCVSVSLLYHHAHPCAFTIVPGYLASFFRPVKNVTGREADELFPFLAVGPHEALIDLDSTLPYFLAEASLSLVYSICLPLCIKLSLSVLLCS